MADFFERCAQHPGHWDRVSEAGLARIRRAGAAGRAPPGWPSRGAHAGCGACGAHLRRPFAARAGLLRARGSMESVLNARAYVLVRKPATLLAGLKSSRLTTAGKH
jgi:hypothetical protein